MIDFAIGKYTLESLTSGMYTNPKVLFREYIQNAIDSIDEAVEARIIKKEDGRVVITIDKNSRSIIIEDNGYGISEDNVTRTLLDIGNSKKYEKNRRGFRGIGRLVGLSYSSKLTFETSFYGENIATEIIFNTKLLNEMLVPGKYDDDDDLISVITKVTKTYTKLVEKNLHYFKVIIEGIEENEVLNIDEVASYISQVAPVPYSPSKFPLYTGIANKYQRNSLQFEEYSIYIRDKKDYEKQLYKLNNCNYLVDKQKMIWDIIKDIEIEEIRNTQGDIIALVWFSKSNYVGTILNNDIKGLRFRKGNILIGDKSTLNYIFKEERFNGWFQGEVFVLDKLIIPNARRDNFERNENYIYLEEQLKKIGNKLSIIIREASIRRNDERKINGEINNKSNLDISYQKLGRQIKALRITDGYNTKYSILNVADNLNYSEKRSIEKVLDVLQEVCSDKDAKRISDEILKRFNINNEKVD
jgi:molecular chaperone HtpG